MPRGARLPALKRRAVVAEVRQHLASLVSCCCQALMVRRGAEAAPWLALTACAAREALIWAGHGAGETVSAALIFIADSLRAGGSVQEAQAVYFALADRFNKWPRYDSVRCWTSARCAC